MNAMLRTMNKINLDHLNDRSLIALPPNQIFRLMSKDWLPDRTIASQTQIDLKQTRTQSASASLALSETFRRAMMYLPSLDLRWQRPDPNPDRHVQLSENRILSAEEEDWTIVTTNTNTAAVQLRRHSLPVRGTSRAERGGSASVAKKKENGSEDNDDDHHQLLSKMMQLSSRPEMQHEITQ